MFGTIAGWLGIGNIVVPLMALLIVAALFAVVRIVARNYHKVAPNEVLVLYGRKYKEPDNQFRGFRLVTGGAAFVIPLLESYRKLTLDSFQVKVVVTNVPSKENVRVTASAVAMMKISSEHNQLTDAVMRFLDRTPDEIKAFSRDVLEGGLRGVVATMTVEELVRDRAGFGSKVQEQVMGDLHKLGIVIDNFVIQEVSDEHGYIDALGAKRTAEVKRDAEIGRAEAARDQNIKVAEAQRDADQRASEAKRLGEIAKAESEQAISDVSKTRDAKIAQNQATVQAEQARIPVASQIATAEMDKRLKVARIEAEEAEVQAQTKLQEEEQKRHDAELRATIIVQASRDKEAAVTRAEGEKKAIELLAEANRNKAVQEAEASQVAAQREAEGRKAVAAAKQTELEAEAAGNQAKLEAEAAGIQAKLEAEAKGVQKKAEAYRQLNQSGQLLIILEHLPEVLNALGNAVHNAGLGTVAPIAQAIGTGLSGIEEVRIFDLGGGNSSTGKDALSRFMDIVPKETFTLLQQVHGLGLNDVVSQLATKFGLDLTSILGAVATAGDDDGSSTKLTPVAAVTAEPEGGDDEPNSNPNQ